MVRAAMQAAARTFLFFNSPESNIHKNDRKGEWTMTASLFVQGLINGLNQGAIYALIALGYTMVYGIIRMINFAHGDFIMIGAYTLFYTIPLMVDAGMPAWMAVIVAVAVCALVGVLVEILAYRPVRKAGPMSALITALAMSIFLENLAMVLFGAKPHNVQAIFSLPTITVGRVSLPLNVLLTIGIGVAMMLCMQLFVKRPSWARPCAPSRRIRMLPPWWAST